MKKSILVTIILFILTSVSITSTNITFKLEDIKVNHETITNKLEKFIGTKYKYGGNNIKKGVDCSGLIKIIYKELFDINIPRTSRLQYKSGRFIEKDSIVVGDLLFFSYKSSKRVRHVGMYAGNNMFIHSSTRHGVIYTSIYDKYYKKAYLSARRVSEKLVFK